MLCAFERFHRRPEEGAMLKLARPFFNTPPFLHGGWEPSLLSGTRTCAVIVLRCRRIVDL